MTVREFLDMYDGNWEISVKLYDLCTEDGDMDILEFLHSERRKISARWLDGEIESWSLRKPEKSGAAFQICMAIATEV